jgi:flagellar hook-length control protein FliK
MQAAIEHVRATIAVAANQGASQARIQLSPESLGSIRIQLQRGDDGLVARVIAERPETARALQQSSGELRRSLEAAGQPLLRLDIEASGQRELPSREAAGQTAGRGEQPAAEAGKPAQEPAAEPASVESTGALVNVLA